MAGTGGSWSTLVAEESVPSGAGGAAGSHVPGCDAAVHTSTACAVPFLDVQSDGRLHEMAYRLHACRWTVHRRWLCFQHGSSFRISRGRSEEHPSALQSLMRISYSVF